MSLTDRIPAIACVQAEGCAPMVQAWKQHQEVAEPVVSPRTHIATLATGDPGRTYTLLQQRIQETGGFLKVSLTKRHSVPSTSWQNGGFSVEPAAAVAFAGLIKAVRAGLVLPRIRSSSIAPGIRCQ